MRKLDSPLTMSSSGTVSFKGYGVAEDPYKELCKLRETSFKNLKDGSKAGTVQRYNILQSMIEFYQGTSADE